MLGSLLPPILGVLGLAAAYYIYRLIKAYPAGEEKVTSIGDQIHLGAMVFMKREFKTLGIFGVILLVLLFYFLGPETALAFVVGALASGLAGYFGMFTATHANVRTTTAANKEGAAAALTVAFFGGSVMGLLVASMGLLGLGSLYLLFGGDPETAHAIHGFGMGASTVALFSRVGGGIYTKSADVGADLVGKVEAGIPEDDPRNPGVIADNVGDNVGDVAGMGSDIFESYCGAMIATIAIASTMALAAAEALGGREMLMGLPLHLASVGLLCSIGGIVLVRQSSSKSPEKALRTGTLGASVLFIVVAFLLIKAVGGSAAIWGAVVAGAVGGVIIGLVTEYYTGGEPVRRIAKSGETGTATVMITGLAVGMQSVVVPVLTICLIIFVSNALVGLYGVGIAAVGMLSTVGIVMATDSYGPIADNAGGLAEMSGAGPEIRKITDKLDALGNTTAAVGKGFAIGSAALTALALFAAFMETANINTIDISKPLVMAGLFLGGMLPFLFSSMAMGAVGRAAMDMIQEVRRQFANIPKLKAALSVMKKNDGIEQDLPARERNAVGDRQHRHIDLAVFLGTVNRERPEMRRRPEEDDQEEKQRIGVDLPVDASVDLEPAAHEELPAPGRGVRLPNRHRVLETDRERQPPQDAPRGLLARLLDVGVDLHRLAVLCRAIAAALSFGVGPVGHQHLLHEVGVGEHLLDQRRLWPHHPDTPSGRVLRGLPRDQYRPAVR